MKKHLVIILSGLVAGLVPLFAYAQNVQSLIGKVGDIVDTLIPVLVAIALAVFFWGLITYIRSAGDPEKAKEGKSIMIYGVIALFVMVSVWGIVKFIATELGIDRNASVTIPTIRTGGGGGGQGSNNSTNECGPGSPYYPAC